MNRLCSIYALAGRCFGSVVHNPGRYVFAGLCAAVSQSLALAQQALLASQDNPQDVTATLSWTLLVIACFTASLAASVPQWALSCAAAQGLGLGAQGTLVARRYRAIGEVWLRMLGMMLRLAIKPWLVCIACTLAVLGISMAATWLGGAKPHGGFWQRLALGPMEQVTLTIVLMAAGCGLWTLGRVVTRLTLIWPLVLAGVAPKEAVAQSMTRGLQVRAWLIGGWALTYLPIFVLQGAALWFSTATGTGGVKEAAAYAGFMVPILGALVAGSYPAVAYAELQMRAWEAPATAKAA